MTNFEDAPYRPGALVTALWQLPGCVMLQSAGCEQELRRKLKLLLG